MKLYSIFDIALNKILVGSPGFEPGTSASSRRRHNHLDHEPSKAKNKVLVFLLCCENSAIYLFSHLYDFLRYSLICCKMDHYFI